MDLPAWAISSWDLAAPYAERLAFWRGYEAEIQTLLIYAVGIALYTLLVFTFYQKISKREPFGLVEAKGWRSFSRRMLTGGVLFPLVSFAYFAVLSLALFVLAKEHSTTYQILMLAMSVIVGVRVTSYMSEGAAVDLAKMLPLGLLGVLLVDPSYAKVTTISARFQELPTLFPALWRFFALFVVLEAALVLIRTIAVGRTKRRKRSAKHHFTKDGLMPGVSQSVPVKGGATVVEREQ